MESTRKHWLALLAGLWMMSPAQANDETQAEAAAHAAANAALTLDGLEAEAAPPAGAAASAATSPGETQSPAAPDTAESLYPAAPAGEQDAQPAASAPRRLIPRGAPARPEAAAESAGADAPAVASHLPAAAPWYRGPYAALGAVLALIAVLTVLARRYVPSARPVAGGVLRVVGRVPVGAKQSAALLQVGRRLVLVGIGPEGLRTLSEITDAEETALILGKTASPPQERFDNLLAEELDEYDASAEDAPAPAEPAREALSATRGQLDSLRSRIRALQSA